MIRKIILVALIALATGCSSKSDSEDWELLFDGPVEVAIFDVEYEGSSKPYIGSDYKTIVIPDIGDTTESAAELFNGDLLENQIDIGPLQEARASGVIGRIELQFNNDIYVISDLHYAVHDNEEGHPWSIGSPVCQMRGVTNSNMIGGYDYDRRYTYLDCDAYKAGWPGEIDMNVGIRTKRDVMRRVAEHGGKSWKLKTVLFPTGEIANELQPED